MTEKRSKVNAIAEEHKTSRRVFFFLTSAFSNECEHVLVKSRCCKKFFQRKVHSILPMVTGICRNVYLLVGIRATKLSVDGKPVLQGEQA